jgi:arylsulfatase A-like enzyme
VRLERGASSVVDITPTLLAMAGLPLARDMDGRVLFELFEPGTVTAGSLAWIDSYGNGEVKKPIIGQADQGDDDGLRNQLQQLGYIDG